MTIADIGRKEEIVDKNANVLGVESRVYECGFCKTQKETLVVPWEVYSQWLWMSHNMGRLEWGAVFTVKDGRVVSWAVPRQEVTGVACEFLEELGGNGIVHSHHSMGSSHSGQDDRQARNLYEYSIVLSHTDYEACRKMPLPCGGYGYRDIRLIVEGASFSELDRIEEKRRDQDASRRDARLPSESRYSHECDDEIVRDGLIPEACHNCTDPECVTCKKVDAQTLAIIFDDYGR